MRPKHLALTSVAVAARVAVSKAVMAVKAATVASAAQHAATTVVVSVAMTVAASAATIAPALVATTVVASAVALPAVMAATVQQRLVVLAAKAKATAASLVLAIPPAQASAHAVTVVAHHAVTSRPAGLILPSQLALAVASLLSPTMRASAQPAQRAELEGPARVPGHVLAAALACQPQGWFRKVPAFFAPRCDRSR